MVSSMRLAFFSSLISLTLAFTVNITRVPVSEPVTPLHHMLAQQRQQRPKNAEKTLQSSEFQINLSNNGDLAYTGPVVLGTPLQGSNNTAYIYDTGSGFLTIPSISCVTCNVTFRYSSALSSTSNQNYTGYSNTLLRYGSASLTGYMMADRVCLSDYSDLQTCVSNFGFFLITKQTGLGAYNGILGLSPNAGQNGPSYVGALSS